MTRGQRYMLIDKLKDELEAQGSEGGINDV